MNDVPILLRPEQKVYIVTRGDVESWTVQGGKFWTWTCGGSVKGNRGYCLCSKDHLGYKSTWNSHIGKFCFTDYESAMAAANNYLETHPEVMLSKDFHPTLVVAYAITDHQGSEKVIYYAELSDERILYKPLYSYARCTGIVNRKIAYKEFIREVERLEECYDVRRLQNYMPTEFKNLYPITGYGIWDYVEAWRAGFQYEEVQIDADYSRAG